VRIWNDDPACGDLKISQGGERKKIGQLVRASFSGWNRAGRYLARGIESPDGELLARIQTEDPGTGPGNGFHARIAPREASKRPDGGRSVRPNGPGKGLRDRFEDAGQEH